MDATKLLEERITHIERELAAIKSQLETSSNNWLDKVDGSMMDFPEFSEVLRLGREYRESLREEYE